MISTRDKRLWCLTSWNPEVDLQAFQAIAPDVPRRILQQDLQQAVAKGVLLASGATHRKRYKLNDEII